MDIYFIFTRMVLEVHICGMENIRLLIGLSNHEQSINLRPYDVRCWHYTKKDSSSQTIVHAMGKDVQGFVVVDWIPGKLGVLVVSTPRCLLNVVYDGPLW